MKRFYEEFWDQMSQDPQPWEWESRRALLLSEVRPDDAVLDLGCGAGRFVGELLHMGVSTIGVDIAEAAISRATINVPGGDLRVLNEDGSIPLDHNSIDLVWCSEVLEHIADTAGVLNEVRRVLKPGGRLLITVPFHGKIKNITIALTKFESHFDPLGQHLRFFTQKSLSTTLRNAHFDQVKINAYGGLPFFHKFFVARAV